MSGGRRRYRGVNRSNAAASSKECDYDDDDDEVEPAKNADDDDDDIFSLLEGKVVVVEPAAKSRKKKREPKKEGISKVVKNARNKKHREEEKKAKRKKVVDEMKVKFEGLPFEDVIESVENQATQHCTTIKAIGADLDQLVGEAKDVALLTETIVNKMSAADKSNHAKMLALIEKHIEKLSKLAVKLRENQNAIAQRQYSLIKQQNEVSERTAETQNNVVLLKLYYCALQQQAFVIAAQTACGNPSYMSKVHQAGLTLLPVSLS